MLRNAVTRYGRDYRLKALLLVALAALFAFGEFRFFFKIFTYLREEAEYLSRHLTVQLVNILNITILSMLFFSNLTNAIYYFFVSYDLELLLSMPFGTRRLIVNRYIENTFASSWMPLVALVPFYAALAASFDLPLSFAVKAAFLHLPFFFLMSGIGAMVTLLVVNFFPARRAYQVLWSLSALFIAVLVVVVRMIRPERLFRPGLDDEFMGFLKGLEAPDYPYLPSTWLTQGITAATFDLDGYGRYAALLFVTAAVSVTLFVVVAPRIYLRCFSRAHTGDRRKGRRSAVTDRVAAAIGTTPVMRSFIAKDIKEIIRDTGQWSQLLLLLGLVFVYLFSVKSLPIQHAITMNIVAFLNTGILGFIVAALVNRFVFPAFSAEGRVLWVIRTLPVNVAEVFWGKAVLYFIPLFAFGGTIALLSNWVLGVDRFIWAFTALNVFVIIATLTVLGLATGMLYPKFRYTNITEVSFSYGGIVYMLGSMLYIGAGLVLQARPMYVYLRSTYLSQAVSYWSFGVFFLLFAGLSAVLCAVAYRRAMAAWREAF